MTVEVRTLSAGELSGALDSLARLRIEVFRAYPYLYDGHLAYEADYLREFATEPGSVLVAALDGTRVVGAATASPMIGQKREFRQPFTDHGIDPTRLFYFGESVLLPEYRGYGIGHRFFDAREAAARAGGAEGASFAAVVRPDDHPQRPAGYRPLDAFWQGRGYRPVPGLITELAWKEHDGAEEIPHTMQFWMRQW